MVLASRIEQLRHRGSCGSRALQMSKSITGAFLAMRLPVRGSMTAEFLSMLKTARSALTLRLWSMGERLGRIAFPVLLADAP